MVSQSAPIGKFLNPATGQYEDLVSADGASAPPGYFLNPATGNYEPLQAYTTSGPSNSAPQPGIFDETQAKADFGTRFAPTPAAPTPAVLDIDLLEYQALAVLPDGSTVDLSPCIEDFSWDEIKGEWAMRFTLKLRDTDTARGQIHQVLALGGKVSFWWRLGHTASVPWRPIGIGTCWDWDLADDGLPALDAVLYDDLMAMLKSDCILVLWPPSEAISVLFELQKDWNIPLADWDGPKCSILRKLKLSGTIADAFNEILAEAFITEVTPTGYGQEYFPRIEFDGTLAKLAVRKPGGNADVWSFAPFQATSTMHVKWSMQQLITQLKVTGTDGNDHVIGTADPVAANQGNFSPVSFVINGAYPELGLIRRIQVVSAEDDPLVQQLRARSEMSQFGAPMRTIEVTTFDNPATRRGDVVNLHGFAGLDDGLYRLAGVSHMPATRQMRLSIDSSGLFDHRRKSFDMSMQIVGTPDPVTTSTTPPDTDTHPAWAADASQSTAQDPALAEHNGTADATNVQNDVPVDSTPFLALIPNGGITSTYRVEADRSLTIFDQDGVTPIVRNAAAAFLSAAGSRLALLHGWSVPPLDVTANPAPPRA